MAENPNDIDDALAAEQAAANDTAAETIDFVSEPEGNETAPSLEDKLREAEDRNLRMQAELQNVLTRSRREVEETRRYGAMGVARDLIPAIDNIDRALEAANKTGVEETAGLADGFRMVRDQIVMALAQNGCQPVETTPGTEFDPSLHEAILQQPSDEIPSGAIVMAVQTGYKLHDRVVRAAQVIVSSGPAS
ncbi:heat shock protein GrpE [Botrimarina colliarenosi]|uniref:Protein GrpE n=1 Tax=Botrimarina colliarenosi TaxID=2528001 RepID=A0A5C6AK33_9BACT|nr:nucleotide exchange factor GrpE [Botrimarina colliarenosi]TWT99381.1 heat shock protein GrpE [Botrimarina colliarenosi]